jgi:hypothetical protein
MHLLTAQGDRVQQRRQRAPLPRSIFTLPSTGRNKTSQQGGEARGKPDLSESKLRLHYKQNLVGHVGKGRVCPSFRLFAPLRFFRFRRSTSWYVIGPCKPLDVTS